MENVTPVVAVLGHVDHGKTTLLDSIRQTNLAQAEVGGITQGIGAYQAEVSHEGQKRLITFIDTPGHQAFVKMRSRGVSAADIAILVVAASEGVKPQTIESISHIKESGIPYIVVLTKSDLPDINTEKVKQELAKAGVMLEGLGGNVPCLSLSAKTGKGLKELLSLILLVWDLAEKKQQEELCAVVIESKLDRHRGALATVVVKSGQINTQDELFVGATPFKVRAIFNYRGQSLKQVQTGEAVEILGFTKVPLPGEIIQGKGQEVVKQPAKQAVNSEEFALSVILKTDNQGSLEAILQLLPKEILIIEKGSGEVTEGDVLAAKAQKAIIVAFNIKLRSEVVKLAQVEKILIKEYKIIYQLLEEIKEVVDSIKSGKTSEVVLGQARILAQFPFNKTRVLGIKVVEGRLAVGDRIKLIRQEAEIGKSKIISMRKIKEEIKVAREGTECGIVIEPLLDFELGDMVLSYQI
ncbi:GTP-binding protein [Candidatus Microgenomates bacterium]|nr:GTP-binding protein [Candidatus Microgenomates bacterium]